MAGMFVRILLRPRATEGKTACVVGTDDLKMFPLPTLSEKHIRLLAPAPSKFKRGLIFLPEVLFTLLLLPTVSLSSATSSSPVWPLLQLPPSPQDQQCLTWSPRTVRFIPLNSLFLRDGDSASPPLPLPNTEITSHSVV